MTEKDQACVILFSGGTDSMLAASLQQESFRKIYLLTYDRYGFHATENTKRGAQLLKERYGEDRVEHVIINIDPLFKYVSYESYFKNLFKHNLMLLSTCGLCKLAMHVRTVKFCMDRGIHHVSDGANQGMTMFPAQMKGVIKLLEKMYADFGIAYSNPVFDFTPPDEGSFVKMENLHFLGSVSAENPRPETDLKEHGNKRNTTGMELYKRGLAPLPNVKGSRYDRQRQPRCFQFILFKMFTNKVFLEKHSYEEYVERTELFFKEKIGKMTKLLGSTTSESRGSARLLRKLFGS